MKSTLKYPHHLFVTSGDKCQISCASSRYASDPLRDLDIEYKEIERIIMRTEGEDCDDVKVLTFTATALNIDHLRRCCCTIGPWIDTTKPLPDYDCD